MGLPRIEINFKCVDIYEQLTRGYRNSILLKRLQLTCTACVEFLNTSHNGRGNTQILSRKCVLSLYDLVINSFITNLKSNLRRTVTTQNTIENNCYLTSTKHNRTSGSVRYNRAIKCLDTTNDCSIFNLPN
jgi:hypothetical protein